MSLYIGNQKVTGIQKVGTDLPDQTGNAGKFLTTDGTNPSWAEVDALPSQTGNEGKFLTTDGTDASWAEVEAGADKDINNLTDFGNTRLQYAPFAINAGVVESGENNTLKFPEGQGSYIVEVTGTLPNFSAWLTNRTVTHTFDEVKTLKSFTATYRLNPSHNTYCSTTATATLANNTTITLASYGLNGLADVTYSNVTYNFSTPTEVKSISINGSFSNSNPGGSIWVENISYVELVQYSSADTIICNPCTITTCDGRTKVFDVATSINISSDMEYKKYNFTEVGTLTKNKSIISGFSTSNYISTPEIPSFANPWEMVFKVHTSATVNTEQYIYGGSKGAPDSYAGINFGIKNSKWYIYLTYSNYYYSGSSTIQANTDYVVKVEWTGNQYNLYASIDNGQTYILEISESGTTAQTGNTVSRIGVYGNALQNPWSGSIDLSGSYIKLNGQLWWQGIVDGTSSDYDYIGATYEGSYSIFKDYETGNLSLVDGFVISKIDPIWTQPILTADGTLGGDSFAVSGNALDSSLSTYKAFDNSSSTQFQGDAVISYIIFYNPIALNVTSLNITNSVYQGQSIIEGNIEASNDGTNWTTIKTFTNDVITASADWDIGLSANTNYYKYYKLNSTNTYNNSIGQASYSYTGVGEIKITATADNLAWLDTSTIPANLKVNGVINNDLVYIGDCTIENSGVTALENRYFNDSGYLIEKSVLSAIMPDYSAGINLTWGTQYTAQFDCCVFVKVSAQTSAYININGVDYNFNGNAYSVGIFVNIPKGSAFKAYGGTSNAQLIQFPMKGVN